MPLGNSVHSAEDSGALWMCLCGMWDVEGWVPWEVRTCVRACAMCTRAWGWGFGCSHMKGQGPSLCAVKNVQETAHSVTLFIVMLLLLSPVMHTLTYTFSNDTIWALAILFLFIHVFCNDYRYINGLSEKCAHGPAGIVCPHHALCL